MTGSRCVSAIIVAAFTSILPAGKATLNVVLALILCGLVAGCDRGESSGQDKVSATGVLAGTVVDSPDSLPVDATPQTYPGAVVTVCEAVEAGTYRVSADAPVMVSYESGEDVAEVALCANGVFEIELEPGTYFVRAFYGEQSYSEDMLVEISEGDVTDVTLELIHGV